MMDGAPSPPSNVDMAAMIPFLKKGGSTRMIDEISAPSLGGSTGSQLFGSQSFKQEIRVGLNCSGS